MSMDEDEAPADSPRPGGGGEVADEAADPSDSASMNVDRAEAETGVSSRLRVERCALAPVPGSSRGGLLLAATPGGMMRPCLLSDPTAPLPLGGLVARCSAACSHDLRGANPGAFWRPRAVEVPTASALPASTTPKILPRSCMPWPWWS